MKRRGFLSLIGAAATAPMIPVLPTAATGGTVLRFNQFTYGLAALHTRIEGGLPLSEMARRFHLSPLQAQALADRLVADGFATRSGGVLTANRPFVQARGFGRSARQVRTERRLRRVVRQDIGQEMPPMLAHLRKISADYGLPLHPARLS